MIGFEDPIVQGAAGSSAAGLALAVIWKIYLRIRGDLRSERAENQAEHANALTIATMERTIKRLDELCTALNHRLDVMGNRLNEEMEAHRQARHLARDAEQTALALKARVEASEKRAEYLQSRVNTLEEEIHALRTVPRS